MPDPGKPKPRRYPRPINDTDSSATLPGVQVFPNGSYVANPFPTTAQAGQQGQFGAMLPAYSPQVVGAVPNITINTAGAPLAPGLGETRVPYYIADVMGNTSGLSPAEQALQGFMVGTGTFGEGVMRSVGFQENQIAQGYTGSQFHDLNIPGYGPRPRTPTTLTVQQRDERANRPAVDTGKVTDVLQNMIANGSVPNVLTLSQANAMGMTDTFLALGYKEVNGNLVAPTSAAAAAPAAPQQAAYRPNVSATRAVKADNASNRRRFSWTDAAKRHARQEDERRAEFSGGNAAAQPVQTQPSAQWTTSYGLVQFNTGTG